MRDQLEVVVRLGDTTIEVHRVDACDELAWAPGVALAQPGGAPARTRVGLADVTLARVARAPRSLARPRALDRRALVYLALSAAAHLLLWGVATDRAPAPTTHGTPRPHAPPIARIAPHALEPGTALPALEEDRSPDATAAGTGSPLPRTAGRAGSDAPRTAGHVQVASRVPPARQLSRLDAIAHARAAGVLGSTALGTGLASPAANADLASGFDTFDVNAPLYGGRGEAAGTFGTARSGWSTSGGCASEPCGTIGTGRGRIGNGITEGYGWGGGPVGGPGGRRQQPKLAVLALTVDGDLERPLASRVLRRNLTRLTYCIERALLAEPTTPRTFALQLLVDASGHAQDASTTGLPAETAACITGVAGAAQFPAARGGGPTSVTATFVYR